VNAGQHVDDQVMALHYDEPAAAEELARWCGGEATTPEEDPDRVVLLVPTAVGAQPAELGDWIVRLADGDFRPFSAEDFAARFTPAEGALPL
jgi:hypothetical protein